MSEHKWDDFDADGLRRCAACTVRQTLHGAWQRKRGGHWRKGTPSPCTGTEAPKPKALEWYGDGKLLYLVKRFVVAGITDSDKPRYWLAGGSDDEMSKPYESIADCMQDAEAEVRRLLREARVKID